MKPNQNSNPPPEELLTRWIDGNLSPGEQANLQRELARQPDWPGEKAAAEEIGHLLRRELSAQQEPESPEFFTAQIMRQIHQEGVQVPTHSAKRNSVFHWLKSAWMVPLATAAAMVVVGVITLRQVSPRESFAMPYTPDPSVTATLRIDDSAGATVINLEGLESIPDDHEIKAFAVTSTAPSGPGEAQHFYAANHPEKLVFVLFPGADSAPAIREVQ
ncbi:MAG: hypothetical protein KA004_15960 [Verrucomicrobiales bacterium]|nr:hypothetical protein [Verrucomicrobiales bacterium]